MSGWTKIEEDWYTYSASGAHSVGVALEKDGLWHVYAAGAATYPGDSAHALLGKAQERALEIATSGRGVAMEKKKQKRKPSSELPVLFARLPKRTHALACVLAEAEQRSLSSWVARLIEAQRPLILGGKDEK